MELISNLALAVYVVGYPVYAWYWMRDIQKCGGHAAWTKIPEVVLGSLAWPVAWLYATTVQLREAWRSRR